MECVDIRGFDYTILLNKRGVSEVLSVVDCKSFIQCAVQCTETPGCNHANFRNSSKCELLQGNVGVEIDPEDEPNTKYICTYHTLFNFNSHRILLTINFMSRK